MRKSRNPLEYEPTGRHQVSAPRPEPGASLCLLGDQSPLEVFSRISPQAALKLQSLKVSEIQT